MDGRCKALVCEASASPFHGGSTGLIFGHFKRENDRKTRRLIIWSIFFGGVFPIFRHRRCLLPNLSAQRRFDSNPDTSVSESGLTKNCDEFSNSKTFELVQSQRFWKFLLFEFSGVCFCVLTGVDMFWTPPKPERNWIPRVYLPHSSYVYVSAFHHGSRGKAPWEPWEPWGPWSCGSLQPGRLGTATRKSTASAATPQLCSTTDQGFGTRGAGDFFVRMDGQI